MSNADQVPVFYRDQNEVCEKPAHVWTRAECRERRKIAGQFFDSGMKFRLFSPRPRIYPVTASSLKSSNHIPQACTITRSEILANVGIAGLPEDVAAPKHIVQRAKQKLKAYVDIYDDLAPIALCARPTRSRIEITVLQ